MLASLAEVMEGEEHVTKRLATSASAEFLRLRLNYATQIARLSALVGLCPRDRERLPSRMKRNELLQRKKLAALLQVSTRTIDRWRKDGVIPQPEFPNRWEQEAFHRFILDKQRQLATTAKQRGESH